MKPVKNTKNSRLSDAEICRRNSWRRGTRIIGSENGKSEIMRITAVGDDQVLAVEVGHVFEWEVSLSLNCRNWKRVEVRNVKP